MKRYTYKHKTITDLIIEVLCFTEKEAKDYMSQMMLNTANFDLYIKPLFFSPNSAINLPKPQASNS